MKNTVLKVRLWGKEVGSLRWDERKGVAYFAYSEGFLLSGLNPFPFVAPLGVAKSYLPIVGDNGIWQSGSTEITFRLQQI